MHQLMCCIAYVAITSAGDPGSHNGDRQACQGRRPQEEGAVFRGGLQVNSGNGWEQARLARN
jgi:hypothetical protein